MNKKTAFMISIIILAVTLIGLWFGKKKAVAPGPKITNFEECAAAGYPVMESYPRQCKTPEGEMFIEKIPENSTDIIPGVKSFLYKNPEFGFNIQYPEGSDIRIEGFDGYLRVTSGGAAAAGIFLPESLFQGTNLSEAVVAIGVSPDPQALVNCDKAADAEKQSQGAAKINGVTFNAFEATGAGAGNLYESKIYRTVRNGSCYEIVELLHSGNIGNYLPGTAVEFDKPKFFGILEKIAQTFVFTVNAGSGAMGTVSLSPTCPVEKIPPDPACVPRPYETLITIIKEGSSKAIASDSVGRFKVDLDPGFYDFTAKGGAIFPRCNPVSVEVKAKNFTLVAIQCDTGIR